MNKNLKSTGQDGNSASVNNIIHSKNYFWWARWKSWIYKNSKLTSARTKNQYDYQFNSSSSIKVVTDSMSEYTTYQFLSSSFSKRSFMFLCVCVCVIVGLSVLERQTRKGQIRYDTNEQNMGAWISTRYLTSEHRERVRYRVEHEKRNSISPSNRVSFCSLYKQFANNKKPSSFTFPNFQRTRCHSNGGVTCRQLISNTHVKFRCGGAVFLSGVNPFKALKFMK